MGRGVGGVFVDRVKVMEHMVGQFIVFTWCVTPMKEVEKRVKLVEMVRVKVLRERELREALEKKFLGERSWAW